VVIERDENQHLGMHSKNEKHKLFMQTRHIVGCDNLDRKRVLMIRYNPDANYVAKGGVEYTQVEREVVLRRWIYWWLYNIESMRTCTIWYMWYDERRRNVLAGATDFPGFAMLYHAPKCSSPNSWENYPTPIEPELEGMTRIKENQVNPDDIKGYGWRKISDEVMFPSGF